MYFVVKRNVYLGFLTILSKMFYSVKYSKLCRDCDSTADKIYRFSPPSLVLIPQSMSIAYTPNDANLVKRSFEAQPDLVSKYEKNIAHIPPHTYLMILSL